MAKECKIIHVNDGSAKVQLNENYHFAETFDWAAEYINRFLREGWEVKHMVPEVSPAIQGDEGSYNFYQSGWTFFLERNVVPDDACEAGSLPTEEVIDFELLDELLDEFV